MSVEGRLREKIESTLEKIYRGAFDHRLDRENYIQQCGVVEGLKAAQGLLKEAIEEERHDE